MPAISVENIQKSFYGQKALKGVSLEVREGSIFGLLGPNGAGKTTLIRIINQILQPDSGAIQLFNEHLKPGHVEQIGYLPEERGLYPKMKVGEQAIYFARLKGMPKKEAKQELEKWFDRFQITDWWHKKVEELSKGMAQKVQFISTVLHHPKLLILDEPFSGFDPINTQLIKEEILRLKQEGTTIIFSTHNMNSVEELCEDIALIHNGEIVLSGDLHQLKNTEDVETYHVEFKGNIIGFTNTLWAGYELIERKQMGNEHFTVTIRLLNDNTLNDLLNTVLGACNIQEVKPLKPSVNDLFINTIQNSDRHE